MSHKCEHMDDLVPCYLRDGEAAICLDECLGCDRTKEEILKQQTIETLEWILADMKWRADQTKLNFEEGSQGDYSPELIKAIELLERWKEL